MATVVMPNEIMGRYIAVESACDIVDRVVENPAPFSIKLKMLKRMARSSEHGPAGKAILDAFRPGFKLIGPSAPLPVWIDAAYEEAPRADTDDKKVEFVLRYWRACLGLIISRPLTALGSLRRKESTNG